MSARPIPGVERPILYPVEWESEYERNGVVAEWTRKYPDLFRVMLEKHRDRPSRLSSRLGTLDLFAQYALQYLLRDREAVESVTWYKLGANPLKSGNRDIILAHWLKMCEVMGTDFFLLQAAVREAGLRGFKGEPDLFCWTPSGNWFFAEAKLKDRLLDSEEGWGRACRDALGERVDLRVYRLKRA